MESAGLRQRDTVAGGRVSPTETASISRIGNAAAPRKGSQEKGDEIPKFTIDLSLPPDDRYLHVVPKIQGRLDESNLTGLFEALVSSLVGQGSLLRCVTWIARQALRRVYDAEETAELKSISSASGVPMYLLVAFNVLLDLLLGCTSGGVRVLNDEGGTDGASDLESRIIHFRTLDWGMDILRNLVVEFDFIRGQGTQVVATTVTYFGYVGVLTGARRGLTMSLNFRPHHCQETWKHRAAFRWHQALVVLGFRRSISSVLRRILLDPAPAPGAQPVALGESLGEGHIATILKELSESHGTAAYIILCTPQKVFVVEKDHGSAQVRDSDVFLTAYNHDFADEGNPFLLAEAAEELVNSGGDAIGMADLVAYSLDRKAHLDRLYSKKVKACRRRVTRELNRDMVTFKDVMTFVRDREICNEETHYAVVMDPSSGAILWRRVYPIS